MNIPTKMLKSGFSLPVYGLGTWQMGGRETADYSNDDAEVKAIRQAIDCGITHIDTAESYGAGHSEELVAQAIEGFDRGKLIIATKISGQNQGYDGVMRAIEKSLKRLNLDYVDLYLLHRYPNPGISIAETMKAMDELIEQEVVKNIGVCNLTANRLKDVQKHSKNKIVYNQLHYSLEVREPAINGVIKYCQDNDVFISAWGPLSKGMLKQAPILQEIAAKYNKTPFQVALNWLISQPNVVTIPKTTSVEHLEENLGSLDWEMSNEDMERLTKEFPNQQAISDRVPLDYVAGIAP